MLSCCVRKNAFKVIFTFQRAEGERTVLHGFAITSEGTRRGTGSIQKTLGWKCLHWKSGIWYEANSSFICKSFLSFQNDLQIASLKEKHKEKDNQFTEYRKNAENEITELKNELKKKKKK